jgi:transcriptional regulator with XRE-family HTH domain
MNLIPFPECLSTTSFRSRHRGRFTLPGMGDTMKTVLWDNVRSLMVEKYGEENLNRLARDAKIGVASVARIKEQKTSVGLDILEAVAKFFKLPPFQLLIPPKEREAYKLLATDKNFMHILRAYLETDERGREILLANAHIITGGTRARPEAGEARQK